MEVIGKVIIDLDETKVADLDGMITNQNIIVDEYLKKSSKRLAALKLVGLTEDIIDRNINTLSDTEFLLVKLINILLSRKQEVIVNNYLSRFDYQHQQMLIRLFKKMAHSQNINIIISDYDKNLLFSFGDVILYDQEYLTKNQFVKILNNVNQDLWPESALFSAYSNHKYQTQLKYYLDIKELIKGIYRKE